MLYEVITINEQVSDTVLSDFASWFAGIGLEKREKSPMAVFCAKSCMVTNHAYGKAFELLGTAAYQALHEFGGIVSYNFV